jgi:hypothetical protein
MYNLCLNDATNGSLPSQSANNKRTMVSITDGSSNTIFCGHGQVAQGNYSLAHVPNAANTINAGASSIADYGTVRGCLSGALTAASGPATNLGRDPNGTSQTANAWGGPFSQGALMGLGDGTVRMFPYTMLTTASPANNCFGSFLTPNNGEVVVIPDQ